MGQFYGIRYKLVDKSKGTINVQKNDLSRSILFKYPCKNTSVCTPYDVFIPPGVYQFELWGAQGGDGRYQNTPNLRTGTGGRGAYVSGKLTLVGLTNLFFYVGGKGEDQIYIDHTMSYGGFNGGGNGGIDTAGDIPPESSAGGGGASDVRLIFGSSFESLISRIIVASGGGGSSSIDATNYYANYQGGDGGTFSGTNTTRYAFPGTQTSGIFGRGSNGLSLGKEDGYIKGGSTGGSGGGYYGGTTIQETENKKDDIEISGAGGSSFISGMANCNAVLNESTIKHSDQPKHFTDLVFNDPVMLMKGDSSFKGPNGESEDGHSGNGFIKLTIISKSSFNIYCTVGNRCQPKRINYFIFVILLKY